MAKRKLPGHGGWAWQIRDRRTLRSRSCSHFLTRNARSCWRLSLALQRMRCGRRSCRRAGRRSAGQASRIRRASLVPAGGGWLGERAAVGWVARRAVVGTARAGRAGLPRRSPARGAPDPAPLDRYTARFGNATGLFVPKPSTGRSCQRRSTLGLGQAVHVCPLAFTVSGGDCHSLGHSVVCACADGCQATLWMGS